MAHPTFVLLLALHRSVRSSASSSPASSPASSALSSLSCAPKGGTWLAARTCSPAAAEGQQWVLPSSSRSSSTPPSASGAEIHLKVTYVEGLCVDAGNGTAEATVGLADCDPARAGAQTFRLEAAGTGGVHIVHSLSSLCLNLRGDHASRTRGEIDLYHCSGTGGGVESVAAAATDRKDGDPRWKVVKGSGETNAYMTHSRLPFPPIPPPSAAVAPTQSRYLRGVG
jgi:hypothetical protein